MLESKETAGSLVQGLEVESHDRWAQESPSKCWHAPDVLERSARYSANDVMPLADSLSRVSLVHCGTHNMTPRLTSSQCKRAQCKASDI